MAKLASERSLKYLRDQGYVAEVVERYNCFSRSRKDFLNVIDIIAIKPGKILGVQSCAYGQATKHRHKIKAEPLLQVWDQAGGLFELHLWQKVNNRWQVKVEFD